MTDAWIVIGVLAVTTFAIKAAGPLAVGGRELPAWAMPVLGLVAPALLAALTLVEAFSAEEGSFHVDARTAGVAVAAVAAARRAPLVLTLALAAGTAAALRALA
ncbi:MAG TPA: AzlD domain-containing protein [Thermoleophilaceae bacterium]|nr:AzlD domain-containing protein [Thermoleophilaceae bacterium]